MTALTQTSLTLAHGLGRLRTGAFLISGGIGLALLALVAGLLALPDLTHALYPHAPGGPDLARRFN